MDWNQEQLEQLFQTVNRKANEDSAFRGEVIADPKAALEKVAGCKLPEGFSLKLIEQDGNYYATYVVPGMAQFLRVYYNLLRFALLWFQWQCFRVRKISFYQPYFSFSKFEYA